VTQGDLGVKGQNAKITTHGLGKKKGGGGRISAKSCSCNKGTKKKSISTEKKEKRRGRSKHGWKKRFNP